MVERDKLACRARGDLRRIIKSVPTTTNTPIDDVTASRKTLPSVSIQIKTSRKTMQVGDNGTAPLDG